MTSLLETMASTSTVGGLVSRLRASVNSSQAEFCSMVAMTTAAVREERTWQNATGRFSKKLGAEYPYLPDLTVPVCLAVEQVWTRLVLCIGSGIFYHSSELSSQARNVCRSCSHL